MTNIQKNNYYEGILLKNISGFCYVKFEDKVVVCKLSGSFKKKHKVIYTGDNAIFQFSADNEGVIYDIKPRNNFFIRPPVANIKHLVIVISLVYPKPNLLIIDKLLSLCEYQNINPILVFNKYDLIKEENISSIYNEICDNIFITSAEDNIGIIDLKEYINSLDGIIAFTGNSGVGKSSLINKLFDLNIDTNEISTKLGRGKHTTRVTQLYEFNNFFIADTPGFGDLQTCYFNSNISTDNLPFTFKEFNDYIDKCKFTSCSHTVEKGCAVIEAVKNKKINQNRFENYKKIYDELKNN